VRDACALAAAVHWADVDGVVIVLDERRGRYFALPPHDAQLWHDVLAGGAMPVDRSFVDELRRRGWLAGAAPDAAPADSATAAPRSPWRTALTLRALGCLIAAELRLDVRGFAVAYGAARLATTRATGVSAVPLATALSAFARAEHLVISKRGLRDCLPRTLALFVFLHRCGFRVAHRIGVKRYPFDAHAWVEDVSAGVLLDAPERTRAFTPLAEIR
jgi:hypothetical protein